VHRFFFLFAYISFFLFCIDLSFAKVPFFLSGSGGNFSRATTGGERPAFEADLAARLSLDRNPLAVRRQGQEASAQTAARCQSRNARNVSLPGMPELISIVLPSPGH